MAASVGLIEPPFRLLPSGADFQCSLVRVISMSAQGFVALALPICSTVTMATLATTVNGPWLLNPFVIGSGPPGTTVKDINRAFNEGRGGVIAKTMSLDHSKVVNVGPRCA